MYPGGRGIEENGRTLALVGIKERRSHGPVDVNRREIAGRAADKDMTRGIKRIRGILVSQVGTGYRVSLNCGFSLIIIVDLEEWFVRQVRLVVRLSIYN